MKKRFVTLSFVFTLLLSTLLVLSGCGDKGPSGETAKGQAELLSLLPDNSTGVIFINFKKLAGLETFDEMMKEAEENADKPGEFFKNYQDFIAKTGIDPKKDIHAAAMAIIGNIGPMAATGEEPDVVFAVNLNYDKNTILGLIKEKAGEFAEDTYNGVAVFKGKSKKGKDMSFAFLSDSIMAGGTPELLQQVIDISKGTGKSIMTNAKMKAHLEDLSGGAIMSFVFDFPEEAKKPQEGGMFKMDFSKAEVLLGQVDYTGSAWQSEIALISHNEEGNNKMVSTLNGLKMFGGAAGPEFAELINNVDISASADRVTIKVSVSDELVEKLKAKIEEQKKSFSAPY